MRLATLGILLLVTTGTQAQRATVQMTATMPESVSVQAQSPLFGPLSVQVSSNLGTGRILKIRVCDTNDFLPPAPVVLAARQKVILVMPSTEFASMDAKLHTQHVLVIVEPKI